jgi:CBS-domain-containing membrane protein
MESRRNRARNALMTPGSQYGSIRREKGVGMERDWFLAATWLSLGLATPFADALTVFAERHVKRFPVVDTEGRLVGIVGRMELLLGFLAASQRSGT